MTTASRARARTRAVELLEASRKITLLPPPPKSLTVLVDTNETYPFMFPDSLTVIHRRTHQDVKVFVEKKSLETGDYSTPQLVGIAAIERKGSLKELHGNLETNDERRFLRAFDRLSHLRSKIVMLDFSPHELFAAPTKWLPEPAHTWQLFMQRCEEFEVPWTFVPISKSAEQAKRTGEFAARWLLLQTQHLSAIGEKLNGD